ncbi:germacrene A synthase-like [Andrographis paniculata]|uniref:germacrene A synthase-like n=1 Tax=Andrographis paniculata TaxID=175694 RepID=UPI0021E7BEC5|nr:germacrene A synthase-like [Andrographis paniculata]
MSTKDVLRPVTNFSSTLWGDQFLRYEFDPQIMKEYANEVKMLKNTVSNQITDQDMGMMDAMNLIDTLERLGIAYHFENEISEKLREIYDLLDTDKYCDLYTTALHFRILRQHGYHISCDIFLKWLDGNGKFQESIKNDIRGLLALYEATHLRIHGESILDYAHVYTRTGLKNVEQSLHQSPLEKQVEHALVQALHLGCPRIEARFFISIYEEEVEHRNESLLNLAKFDYNLLQILHKKELQELSRWWKELNLISKHKYAKDRLVECYFWAAGVYYEPEYSRGRIMLTKLMIIISITDDTYDAYGTLEELQAFTKAIERWDIGEIVKLPNYMREFYKTTLELYQEFEDELSSEGRSYAIKYAIDAHKELVRNYYTEAKWFMQGIYPTFEDYLSNGHITCTYFYHTMVSLLGMKSLTEKEFEYLHQKPKMIVASGINCRLIDDITSYEVEKERGQVVTGIDCFMKDNNATKEEAVAKLHEIAENAWKDINEEFLKSYFHWKDVVKRIMNISRIMDVAYKNDHDGYTKPEKNVKPHIIALFVDPIKY